jgi:hypothetical protein
MMPSLIAAALLNGIDFRTRKSLIDRPDDRDAVAVNLLEALGAAEEATQDRITIYVPSRDRDGKPVDFESWVMRALELLSLVGGGATRMPPAQGAWLNPDTGALIIEDVTLVYSYVDGDALAARLPNIRRFLHELGRALNQGEVVIEVNENFYKIRDFDV